MCIGIGEIWSGVADGKIRQVLRVICTPHYFGGLILLIYHRGYVMAYVALHKTNVPLTIFSYFQFNLSTETCVLGPE